MIHGSTDSNTNSKDSQDLFIEPDSSKSTRTRDTFLKSDFLTNITMQTQILATLLMLVAIPLPAQARLMETTEECDVRYGPGKNLQLELGDGFNSEEGKNWTAKLYSARGLAIQVIFENNVASLIRYSNEPPVKVANSITRPVNLTAGEVTYLRKVNLAEGSSWKSHKDTTLASLSPNMTFWISSDKLRYAAYDRDNRQLFLCSDRFWEITVGNLRNQAESSPAIRFKGL